MSGARPARASMRRQALVLRIFAYATLAVAWVIFVFPLLWVLGLSFKTRAQVFANPPLWVWTPTLENYARVLQGADFLGAFVNSTIISGGAVGLSLAIGVPAAYAFARFPFPGRNLLFFALLVMRMLPPIAVLVQMFVLFSKAGIGGTHLSVILAYTTFALPLVVWILRGYFEEMPRELKESAWVDGASRAAAFRLIVLPLVRPGIVAATILAFIFAWNDFLFAAVLTRTEVTTYTVQVTHYFGGQSNLWAKIAAMSVLGTIPVFFTVAVMQRYLVRGISMGAVKG